MVQTNLWQEDRIDVVKFCRLSDPSLVSVCVCVKSFSSYHILCSPISSSDTYRCSFLSLYI